MNIEVIDNFLDPHEFEELKDFIFHPDENSNMRMNWVMNYGVTNADEDSFQFNHMFYADGAPQSDQMNLLVPILTKIPNLLSMLRIKANLLTRTLNHEQHGYHVDMHDAQGLPHKSAIFYCNTNNGWTQFENGTKVESIANRMVMFDGQLKHCSVSQTDEPFRVVINFVYIEKRVM